MKILVMIPARLGSKRIPKKNIRFLGEKPLIQYPIDLAKTEFESNEIFVNTESDLIGEFAISSGVQFYKRPEQLAIDSATNQDFVTDFLTKNECDYLVMLNRASAKAHIA